MVKFAALMVSVVAVTFSGQGLLVQVPDPLAGAGPARPLAPKDVPRVGVTFIDGAFRTRLTRVTAGPSRRHEYSRYDPYNKGQTLILLRDIKSGDYVVCRTSPLPYDRPANVVYKLPDIEEPRWDAIDPNCLWGLRQFQIVTVNVRTGKVEVVKDFRRDPRLGPIIKAEPDLYRITRKIEGEASMDRRWWCLGLQGKNEDYRLRYVFTWDRRSDRVVGLYKLSKAESEIDWVGMSPLGNYVLIGGMSNNGGRLKGLTMANRELTRFHRLDYTTSHSDVGIDRRGREVIVMQNSRTDYIDLIPIDWRTRPILEAGGSYSGTNRVRLVRLFYSDPSPHGFTGGVHVSCNAPGRCVVSTYQAPGKKADNWLSRKIVLVVLDRRNPRVYYLAHVYSTYRKYWEETHATITVDGAYVVWASNWGRDVGREKVFMIRLDMPRGPRGRTGVQPGSWPGRLF